MVFKDHFSSHAANYAAARPHYPVELFSFLAQTCQARELAWDCGTGNGQAAIALAQHFARVVATDASQTQLDEAAPHPRVEYQCLTAEAAPLPAGSADLVTVAQALHWFDTQVFFDIVTKVLKPGGVLAVWSYGLTSVTPSVDRVVKVLYEEVLGEYWPPERQFVERAYRDFSFPFNPIAAPVLHMQCNWSLQQFVDYLLSWSATRRYIASKQRNPLDLISSDLHLAWGDQAQRQVAWPLTFKVYRK